LWLTELFDADILLTYRDQTALSHAATDLISIKNVRTLWLSEDLATKFYLLLMP
jgi:hypothetical protein